MSTTVTSATGGALPAPLPRRRFLGGLLTLPLIGGGVTLIGQPTAAAEPITPELLDNYRAWLHHEFRLLSAERFPEAHAEQRQWVWTDCAGGRFHNDEWAGAWNGARLASKRAAVVLAAVGCDWRQA